MKTIKRILFWTGLVFLLALLGLAIDISVNLYQPVPLEESVEYPLESGSSLQTVARQLHERGIIKRPFYFSAYARLNNLGTRLQAGEYIIEPGLSPVDILAKMEKGDVKQYSLTIVEGWTFQQLMKAVRGHPALKPTLEAAGSDGIGRRVMTALGQPNVHPEGQFLPDTYLFSRGMTDIAFLRRAHMAMKDVLIEEWAQKADNLPLKSPYHALILASIIEKETAKAEERARIAAVFVNRLRKGMRLQTDPTVIYGIGEDFDGDIRFRDLREDTPYNTYTRRGLPPTPIALPGRDAIHAALHPADSEALYFVSKGDGSHVFSTTLEEHEAAVDRYQRRRRGTD